MRRITLYDTYSRETRLFVPLHPPRVGLFVCGMTPYAEPHVGHGRTFVTFDVVARALRSWGYRVFYVQNVTNVDDKLIDRASELGDDPLQLADRYFRVYLAAMADLSVKSPNYYPYATDYVPEIIEQIHHLIDRRIAYPADGSVYYEVARFANYGRLSGQRADALRPGTRLETDPSKKSPEDFVIWKAAKPGEPTWESPWGPGRPGWHIEDTAITLRLFGSRYDIHGGGVDLKFPHHEGEIALAEGATGEAPLVNYWMHAGMLDLRGEKMAKSVGNVVSLPETIARYGGPVLRFYYLNAQYRAPLEFQPGKSLEEAREAYERLAGPIRRIDHALAVRELENDSGGIEIPDALETLADRTVDRLDDILSADFNTREAIAELFGWARQLGEWTDRFEQLSANSLGTLAAPYRWAMELLGLFDEATGGARVDQELQPWIQALLAVRQRARERGDYAESDRIREQLLAAGIRLHDAGTATRWERVPPGG